MRWLESSIAVVAAWGLGALIIWGGERTETSVPAWGDWWPAIILALAFLVGISRPLLRGVFILGVASIVVGYAAFMLWIAVWALRCTRCGYTESGFRYDFDAWQMIAAAAVMAGLFAVITIGTAGVGTLTGQGFLHGWRRLISQPQD